MTVTFISNYLSHHQVPFCDAMYKICDEFYFISTTPISGERKALGWGTKERAPYELKAYSSNESKNRALQLVENSDVLIMGDAPEEYAKYRLKNKSNQLTFRYSERIYKGGRWRVLSPRGAFIRFKTYFRYIQKPLYMLCASSYTAGDLAMLGSYLGRCFKWGYYPETRRYENIEELIGLKHHASILWVARLIGLKHPEVAIEIADRLKKDGYDFTLNIIGIGEKEKDIEDLITQKGLQGQVHMLGSMSPERVRDHMEKSEILLFTSDRNEGWGAVLNEAMNSGCAVVANDEIGSVPFLIKDGENGLTYHKGNVDELYQKVKQLLDKKEYREQLGASAYRTITEEWCAEVAAERLIHTCENLLKGNKVFYENGPCSKAEIR